MYLFSTTELYELLKIPVLVEHFFEHKHKNPALSLMDFMDLHYNGDHLDNHQHDDDYEQDKRLPFMLSTSILTVCGIPVAPLLFEPKYRYFPSNALKRWAANDNFIESNAPTSIWQPPKSC